MPQSRDTELTSATVTLTNHDTDDVLVFAGAPPAGIMASAYDSATGILTLTGAASLAAYQTALQQITFDNTGTTPSTATRVIDIVVNDGASNSNTAKAFIEVKDLNNGARCWISIPRLRGSLRTTFHNAFTENGAPVPIADTDTTITDRQQHDCFRDDHADQPANRRSAHGQRGAAGSDHHGWLRFWYRRPHAHRFGHAG